MDLYFIFNDMILSTRCNLPDPVTRSQELSERSSDLGDFLRLDNPPESFSGDAARVTLEYSCTGDYYVGVEVISDVTDVIGSEQSVKVFTKVFKCTTDVERSRFISKNVRLKLPSKLAFNYNALNKKIALSSKTKIRAWMLDTNWWPLCLKYSNCYTRSAIKVSHNTNIDPPFSRPFVTARGLRTCKSFSWILLFYSTSFKIPQCPVENEVVQLIQYPVALSGEAYGVYRKLEPYNNPDLEDKRRAQIMKPRFTVSVWLYLLEHCFAAPLCSVLHHSTWDAKYKTPLLFITQTGNVHIQVEHTDGQQTAGIAWNPVPLNQWIRIVLTFNVNSWTLAVTTNRSLSETKYSEYRHEGPPVRYDDTEGLFSLGGSENTRSVRGYIGQATLYRHVALRATQIPLESLFHPMFELGLSRREESCASFLHWVQHRVHVHWRDALGRGRPDVCTNPFYAMLQSFVHTSVVMPVCGPDDKVLKHRKYADRLLRNMLSYGLRDNLNYKSIADKLYRKAMDMIDVRLRSVPTAFPLLKQSACLGNMDAMYTAAVILNNGIHVKADDIQSQAYLMLAALDNHRLAALALGHKHRNGLDGLTVDLEQSYRYYKFVADTARADKELHKDTDVLTESIRLTDELAINEQTDENGDIFHWLSHQAKQGVLSAQNRVGRALFWGSQGLQRNLEAAVEYFRMSADTGDAQSQYDYGIVLMRGQGTKKDVQAGLQHIQKAAEQKNPAALNAMGWHAQHYERDMTKAAEYYERAYRLSDVDATFNLGIMHMYGKYPGLEKDVDKAMRYFSLAAPRGHLDAGVMFASINIKGTSRQPRQVFMAAEWARYIAEMSPAIGLVLRKGIKAFKAGKSDVSLFYYALAADAGVEVGSFNLAWLCEENKEGVTTFIEKECVWSKYNISIQRESQFVDSYALLKMGDYYWYGCQGNRDIHRAADMYAQAAVKNNPQALFNLAFMVEEGVDIPTATLRYIRVPLRLQDNNATLLTFLYTKCRESPHSEAYLPCSIALWRVQLIQFWDSHQTLIKVSSVLAVMVFTILSSYTMFRVPRYTSQRRHGDDANI
ncbi:protein sel-1 homolog 3-like isoform X2 [Dreissena polymorpha]|uniref:protein sel-1 homolog 3-like isoform X2 n=1 Tax=Dreissena polymorpha TaxID=45954 RepID=UPI0022643583|nr:protein sel-1 homolog 3-like isoform X2 [Dreissena polymorpha]